MNVLFLFTDVDEQLLEDRIRKKVLSELRRTTYHWTPLKYDLPYIYTSFQCHKSSMKPQGLEHLRFLHFEDHVSCLIIRYKYSFALLVLCVPGMMKSSAWCTWLLGWLVAMQQWEELWMRYQTSSRDHRPAHMMISSSPVSWTFIWTIISMFLNVFFLIFR